jgi:mannosyl-oligosaccharide alpha-1,2-mannosidase
MLSDGELVSKADFSVPRSPQNILEGGESWKEDFVIKPADTHNLQRPETVESLFYMWRITGDEMYRRWGWEIFEAFVKHTAVEGGSGFSSIQNVLADSPEHLGTRDNMESFWPVSQPFFEAGSSGVCANERCKHRPKHSNTSTSSSHHPASSLSTR